MASERFDLFLFLGDTVYADAKTPEELLASYLELEQSKEFQKLKSSTPLDGTWDDHDYGTNDIGKEYRFKEDSQIAFLKFYGFPKESPIWKQEGVYHSRIVNRNGKKIKILFLDTRYHRTALHKKWYWFVLKWFRKGAYVPSTDEDQTILGEAQWKWLETEAFEKVDFLILVSSIQVLQLGNGLENWGNFPTEREKLFQVLKKIPSPFLVISGDRHAGEIQYDKDLNFFEVTSSSLNKPLLFLQDTNEENQYRIGTRVFEENYGEIILDFSKQTSKVSLKSKEKKLLDSLEFLVQRKNQK